MLAFGSEEMRVVADVCESTWADEQPDLTPFSFVLLLPEKEALPWWQYLHARFPLSLGFSKHQPPTPLPVYIDLKRWAGGTKHQLFDLVVTHPHEGFDWTLLGEDSVLVVKGQGSTDTLASSFVSVIAKDDYIVGVGYNGTPTSLGGLKHVSPPPAPKRTRAGMTPSTWRNFLRSTKWN